MSKKTKSVETTEAVINPIEALKAQKAEVEAQIAEFKLGWAKLQEQKDAITAQIKEAWATKSAETKAAKEARVSAQVEMLTARLAALKGNA